MTATEYFGLMAAIYLSPRLDGVSGLTFAVVCIIAQVVTGYAGIAK